MVLAWHTAQIDQIFRELGPLWRFPLASFVQVIRKISTITLQATETYLKLRLVEEIKRLC